MKRTLLVLLLTCSIAAQAQFTQGNLAVFVAAASTNNTNGSVIELAPGIANAVAVNGYPIPSGGSDSMRFSGSATSTGYLANNNNRTLLAFTGAMTTNTTANTNTILTRGVGTFNYSGAYSLATTYTGSSGSQPRSATTVDNTNWYITDQGGLFTNNATAVSNTGNYRAAKPFGGTVYVSTASSISTVSAPSGGTVASLGPSFTNLQDFYLVSSGANGATFDLLYVVTNSTGSSNTAGSILKYSLVGGTWTANGSYTTTFGGFGLAAQAAGSSVYLYVTTGAGALTANSLIRLTDIGGYNNTININTASNLTLYTTLTGTIMKGVAFAPVSPLSVHLKTFDATRKGNANVLSWTTASEDKGDKFTLTRSADGVSFQPLALLTGKGTNSNYTYTDRDVAGTIYYRLSIQDAIGNVHFSKVVKTETGVPLNNSFSIYPNPLSGRNLFVRSAQALGTLSIALYDMAGRKVCDKNVTSAGVEVMAELPDHLIPGVYVVEVTTISGTSVQKIVVQ